MPKKGMPFALFLLALTMFVAGCGDDEGVSLHDTGKGDTQDAECESSPVPGQKCGLVAGFGTSQKYCNCRFDAPTTNTNSKYAYLTPAQDFVDFFKSLKKDPGDVGMAVIIGAGSDGAPDNCSSPDGMTCAGKRYHETAKGLGNFVSASVCQSDFSGALADIADALIE